MRPSLLRLGGSGRCLGRQPLRAATEQAALHSPRQQHGSTIPAWQDLYTASQLSRWAGMLYMPTAECVRAFEEEGLTVVHHARDKHTCWAVVEGQVDADRFAREALGTASSSSPPLSMASTSSQDAEDQQRRRFVLMRGVQVRMHACTMHAYAQHAFIRELSSPHTLQHPVDVKPLSALSSGSGMRLRPS